MATKKPAAKKAAPSKKTPVAAAVHRLSNKTPAAAAPAGSVATSTSGKPLRQLNVNKTAYTANTVKKSEGVYGWEMRAPKGQLIATNGEPYTSQGNARRGVLQMLNQIKNAEVVVGAA